MAHLLRVAGIVLENGGTEDEAIAALLHDAVEDQGGKPVCQEIGCRFGERVAAIVEGCTDSDVSPKPPWRQRKEAHLAGLRHASDAVRLVVAADKLDNARALLVEYRRRGESLWDFFKGGRDGTLWYYRSMIEILQAPRSLPPASPSPLVEELRLTVEQLDQLIDAAHGT